VSVGCVVQAVRALGILWTKQMCGSRLQVPDCLGFLQEETDGGEASTRLLELRNAHFHPGEVYSLLEQLENILQLVLYYLNLYK